jgi:hypothetical protein
VGKPDRPVIRYEDAAEYRTGLEGWVCRTCRRYWGAEEHIARRCCATELPCPECGGRNPEKGYTVCRDCRRKHDDARWAALERVEWDGATPLCRWDGDRYYVAELVNETLADGGRVEDLRLVLCEPDEPRCLEMAEFQQDHLPADFDAGGEFDEIDKLVNDWIEAHMPRVWLPTNRAIAAESLKAYAEPEGTDV